MKVFALYLRARRTGASIGCILLLAAAIGLALAWSTLGVLVLLTLTLMPAAIASVVGLSVTTPFGDLERMVSLPLTALRLGHLGGLVLVAVLALAAASSATSVSDTWVVLVRNTLGYAGLALIAATLLGPAYSWLVPVLYSLIVLADGSGALWAWPLRPTGNLAAATAAGGLLVLGLAIVARWEGDRTRRLGTIIRSPLGSISPRS